MTVIIDDSILSQPRYGTPTLREYNTCHDPGSGQFCSTPGEGRGGGPVKLKAPKSAEERFNAFINGLFDAGGYSNPFNNREIVVRNEAILDVGPDTETGGVHLYALRAVTPRSGAGTRTMQTVFDLADTHGLTLTGTAKAFKTNQPGTMTTTQLKAWYKRLGFDVDRTGSLLRTPK